jgi:hypothetical protein
MVNRRTLGIIVLVVGLVVLAVSLLADPIGIGDASGFGGDQIRGTIAGAIVTVVGLVLMLRK